MTTAPSSAPAVSPAPSRSFTPQHTSSAPGGTPPAGAPGFTIPGYTGHVPRKRYDCGKTFAEAANVAWARNSRERAQAPPPPSARLPQLAQPQFFTLRAAAPQIAR